MTAPTVLDASIAIEGVIDEPLHTAARRPMALLPDRLADRLAAGR